MNPVLAEVQRIGGNPADDVWWWFVNRGPHGSEFTWAQTKSSPPGYVGLLHLQEIVAREEQAAPGFTARSRAVALSALQSSLPELIRRGLQVLAVVGDGDDIASAKGLTASDDSAVVADAKACIFELKMRR